MNKKKVFIVSIAAFIVIVAILMYNKSRMEAKSKPDTLTAIPVTVTKAEKMELTEQTTLVGTITANNDIAIVSETQGKVTSVHADVGDYKPAGSVLIQVDDELKRAAYEATEVNYEKAKKDYERIESLRQQNSASDQQYESVRLAFKGSEAQYLVARRQYNDTKIKTPISGVVSSRTVDVGTMVQNAMVVANVVDISKLKVKMNVAEKDAFKLNVGDRVSVTTDVYPGKTFDGKITSIGSKADEAHTYPVEVIILNSKDHPLKAGMFGRVMFQSIAGSELLSIPREALVGSVKKPQVYVIENQTAKLRDLIIGSEVNTSVAVLSGLEEGATIVVSGQNNLRDGATVSIVK